MLIFFALTAALQPSGSCCAGMAKFASDPAFIAAHLTPLPFHFASRQGRSVSYPAGDSDASGYFVAPNPGIHTAIVMVHEWWGLNDYIKHEAVALHDRTGYAVLALDLYNGHVATNPEEAG